MPAKTATAPLTKAELKKTALAALSELKKTEPKNPRRTTLARTIAQEIFDELQAMKSNEYSWEEIAASLVKRGINVKPEELQGALAKEKYQRGKKAAKQ
jgi:predicted CopG family antitoxin